MKALVAATTLALGAAACPGAARAAGITYDCDTAAGHFSQLVLPTPGGPFTVTGNVQVNQIAKDKQWAPLARVRIVSAAPALGASPTDFAGFKLTALPGKELSMSPAVVQFFSFDRPGNEPPMIPGSIAAQGPAQPFRISFDGKSATVAVAGATQSYPLTAASPAVEIICSTGEFLLTDLAITTGG